MAENNVDPEPRTGWGYFCLIVALAAAAWAAALIFTPVKSDAAPAESPVQATNHHLPMTARWQQPYGGCKEAYVAPQSAGADECRAHGWVIRPRLVVGPYGWVRYSTLPQCRNEDGSGQRSACSWNFGMPRSWGKVYWVDYHNRTHYVRGVR